MEKTPPPQVLMPAEIHKLVDEAHNDAIDLSFHIKLAMREFNDDPQASFALLRSIDRFSDEIFDRLVMLREINEAESGGAA